METNRKPHLIWLMAIENLFENNQRDNYITTRQMYNQWRQIESLVLFRLMDLEKNSFMKINRETIIITMRQRYNQWRQIESLISFGSWT